MILFGISGKRGSGKSLLGSYLVKNWGFEERPLAGALKHQCRREFGLIVEQTDGIFKEQPTQYRRTDGSFYTPRDIMIRVGSLYRSIDPEFWLKKALSNLAQDGRYVITDVRFANECRYIRELGGKLIRIEREQELNCYKAALDDLSETELDAYGQWDFKLEKELNRVPADLEAFSEQLMSSLVRDGLAH